MPNWYKEAVAKLTLADVMPEIARDVDVSRLDAERERLAREYEAADGALLLEIAKHLRDDGSGRWSGYIRDRDLPGRTTPHERMQIASGSLVGVTRFSSSSAYRFTHCPDCSNALPECICPNEERLRQEREEMNYVLKEVVLMGDTPEEMRPPRDDEMEAWRKAQR